jgi:pimeloyl-ACP methyl ester carboxylesterase
MQASMEALARLYLEEGSRAGADRIAGAPNRLQLRKRDPAAWHLWYDDLVNHSAEGMALTLRNYQARRPSLYSFEDRLARLLPPALLVVGDEDEGCIDVNLFLKRTLPEAGLWISPHVGHAVNLDAPAEFNKEVRSFIEAVEAAVALVS